MAKSKKPKPKSWQGKLWWFLWHDDSILSWVVNIVLAVVIIKFLVYPGLGLIFGTNFPVVAVVSGSMEHQGQDFDEWWSSNKVWYLQRGITKDQFEEYPFKNGFNTGDLMVLTGVNPEDIEEGTVVVFMGGESYPVIHRVVNLSIDHVETKGDNNPTQCTPSRPCQRSSTLDERNVSHSTIVGKASLRIPLLGYIKILASHVFAWFGLSIG